MIDFDTDHIGVGIVLTPISDRAQDWFADNIDDPECWQDYGDGTLCEPRQALDIMEVLLDQGFTLRDAATGRTAGGETLL